MLIKYQQKRRSVFLVTEAMWMPEDVKKRFMEQQSGKINKNGEFVITSQTTRSQKNNLDDCFEKLQSMLDQAAIEPKIREIWTEPSELGKARRIQEKKKRTETKQYRNKIID